MLEDLFIKMNELYEKDFSIKISYLEIYNEKIRDLLVPTEKRVPLMIIEDSVKGMLVPDLSEYEVKNNSDVIELIK